MNTLEIIAVLTTVICVILTGKQNVWCWPFGIVSVLSLIVIFVNGDLYAQVGLQIAFLIQSLYGWYNWGKVDTVKVSELDEKTYNTHKVIFIILGVLFAYLNIYLGNREPITNIFAYTPFIFDGIAAFIGLLANWYLTKKIIQAWPLFMTYNAILFVLLFHQGLIFLAFMNVFLFYLSVQGLTEWKKDLKTV